MSDNDQSELVDLTTALGADAGVSPQCFSIYIPNKDHQGNEFGTQRRWVLEARQLLCEMNGGATVMPAVEGGWVNDSGETIWENPVIVYSFVQQQPFLAHLPKLRAFLHRLGRETNQGEIVVEFDGDFYRIRTFDPA